VKAPAALAVALVAWSAGQWRPEERVVVSDFSTITALAASSFTMYAATPRGLLVYDRGARRWQLPVTRLDGYPDAAVRVALADLADEAVWLGTTEGWARYDPRIRQWQSGPAAGGVSDLAQDVNDPAAGVYLRTATGWSFLPRGALLPFGNRAPPTTAVRPLDPRAALARAPQADALRALILTDPQLRTYQFTAAAATSDRGELFFGTSGVGVVRLDGFGARWETLAYGLPAPGARALAPASDGVWVGLDPRPGERGGLALLPAELDGARWLGGAGATGLGFRSVRRLLTVRGRLWAATEQGIATIDPANERVALFHLDEPIALAAAPDGIWVGTTRGLAFVADGGAITDYEVGGVSVLSLVTAGDSVWIGGVSGLGLLAPGARAPVVPAELAAAPALRAPIVALARRGDTLVAATRDQIAWREPQTGRWTVQRPNADVGRLTALAPDPLGIWIGGDLGVTLWRPATGARRTLRVPEDLPAAARDLLVQPPYLWVATDSGVVRLVREAVIER
jgi:ligand-binding sensor domain-containing protein